MKREVKREDTRTLLDLAEKVNSGGVDSVRLAETVTKENYDNLSVKV